VLGQPLPMQYGAHRCPFFDWGWRYGWLSDCPDCGGETFEHGSGI
jgi:hypothetical protein